MVLHQEGRGRRVKEEARALSNLNGQPGLGKKITYDWGFILSHPWTR